MNKNKTLKTTYPIPKLEENYKIITQTYNLLNEHIKLGVDIHPAGEWILDNYYLIEETVKTAKKELDLKKYLKFLPSIDKKYKGYAKVYALALEIVDKTENKIEAKSLGNYLKEYQKKDSLNIDEIWNVPLFLQIVTINNIREISEQIYISQIQRYKVENIIERLVDNTSEQKQLYKTNKTNYTQTHMPYSFIEYMAYKLKTYGKQTQKFLQILEEQVEKSGVTVEEVVKREHIDIAQKKVLMGNYINTIRDLLRFNFEDIFEEINIVEDLFKQDPANQYTKMDYKSKSYYKNQLKKIAQKVKVSEIYVAKRILKLAKQGEGKKSHVGYYLINKTGITEILNLLQNKRKKPISNKTKAQIYIIGIWVISILISILINLKINNMILKVLGIIMILIPIQEIIKNMVQYILSKKILSIPIPKIDLQGKIPKEMATFVVIPTIIKEEKKIKELIGKLEVFYLANKSENIYFALLGDVSPSSKQNESYDKTVVETGMQETEKLNKKYATEDFPKFHFIYRKRSWNPKENIFLGWERKRGILTQFNEYLLGHTKNEFQVNTIEKYKKILPKIKYIITLDADTELVLNTGLELIGAMGHILNTPQLNKQENLVIDGHALMQPRIGVDLLSVQKSDFTRIYAANGGTDIYANAISDVYQDNFEEGIFTGKGIYDLEIFSKILKNEIPENTVLSHDLLEGSYLRCGLVTDVLLLDGTPTKYNSFIMRQHRWIRGDWQIIKWIYGKNPLNLLSRYKIFDNLVRSLNEIIIIISLLYYLIIGSKSALIFASLIISGVIGTVIDILNNLIYRKENVQKQKNFSQKLGVLQASILRGIINLSTLPHKAYVYLNAIIKTIYRLTVSKQHLLEWTTAEEAEKQSKSDLGSYYKTMIINIVTAIIVSVIATINFSWMRIFWYILSILWIIAPWFVWYISKPSKKKTHELKAQDTEYIIDIAKKTWQYFKDNLNEQNNFLPSDNYQEDRTPKLVNRTSSTNIGLAILSVISAQDMNFITKEETILLLNKMLETILKLPKWNGHLYNWYNINTLEPLVPRYVSTVDSGNFIGYLYVLKQYLLEQENNDNINNMIKNIDNIIINTNFYYLYNENIRLLSIGYNVEENQLTNSYYDLLASEARQASLVAIAKKDISAKHWNNLSRTLTALYKYKGLISWSGTAFEYLMPNINIPRYPGSLLDESCKFMIMTQKEYSKKLGLPWGISESAFSLKDLNGNYQYKAFGIPWLGLKRGLSEELVIAPYASILAISDEPKEVINNLKILEKEGAYDKYGFYEAIDYTPFRLSYKTKKEIVKTYMAHHQGLILVSINNLLNNSILQKRFTKNPEIQAVDVLLQETMPEKMIITKEHKEKPLKLKYNNKENYMVKVYTKLNEKLNNCNCISNEKYSIITDEYGRGYSKYKNILINRYKETSEEPHGIYFYIKNIRTKRIWTNNYMNYLSKADKYEIHFAPDNTTIKRTDGDIMTTTKITVSPNQNIEIRKLELKNNGNTDETVEITSYLEPVISKKEADYAHMAFNNLFLKYEQENESIIVKRKKREENSEELYLGVNLYTESETIGDLEFEIDKQRFVGRTNLNVPQMIQNSTPFTKTLGLVTDPIIAMKRTITIPAHEIVYINLIVTVANKKEEIVENLQEYMNQEKIENTFELAKAKAEAEMKYLRLTGKQVQTSQKILSYLILQNPLKTLYINQMRKRIYSQAELWKFGISGDKPILLVKIQDISDIYVIKEIMRIYEYLKIKNINFDLIILNEENYSYELNLKSSIENEISNSHLEYLINKGIYIINATEISRKDTELLEFIANLILNAKRGNIQTSLSDMEEEYLETIQNVGEIPKELIIQEKLTPPISINLQDLKYNNEFGGFTEDGKEFILKINKNNKLPTVWSHILANENFGTIITENLGGFTWSKNSRLKRLTAWANNAVIDIPSEIIYLKDEQTGQAWTMGNSPKPDEKDYYLTYGFGYIKSQHASEGIIQELEIFVPQNDAIKINILKLKNTLAEKRKLKVLYYVKNVLSEDEVKSNGFINLQKDESSNMIIAQNLYGGEVNSEYMYIMSNEKIKSYTGNKKFFIGKRTLENPEALDKVSLDNKNSLGQPNCMAIEINIELKAYEDKEIILALGAEENILDAKNMAYKYSKISNCRQELEKVKKYWIKLLENVQVKTPLESMNIMLNGWNAYQTINSRLWGKTGYYQSGGAVGFRDQLQDTLGMKFLDTNFMKQQIIEQSKHQFVEGDVLHWWHEAIKSGIRTKFSDDLLWLVYTVIEYIEYTGDFKILDIKTNYVKGIIIEKNKDEKYDKYLEEEIEEEIYKHCIKAIEKSLDFGERGLPKIGSGDWNDGFSTVGNKGKGESVWLGFFLYDILNRFIPICEHKEDFEKLQKYNNIKNELKRELNISGWDGRWYKRAYTDNGDALGSMQNEECKIDSIAQSWSVISGAGDNDKKYISMESLENHLIDRENGIIKLLDPPFEKGKLEPGYIKGYLPGVRENGGQYTHAAIWTIIAESILGFGDKATELYRMINPIEHSRTKEMAQKYKVEPYVIPADIYGIGNLSGRGGWTWYTGSSGWYYKAGIEYILGIKIKNNVLIIEPCIPSEWKEYEVKYRHKTSIYNIKVKNPNGAMTGIKTLRINKVIKEDKKILLKDNGKIYYIEAEM